MLRLGSYGSGLIWILDTSSRRDMRCSLLVRLSIMHRRWWAGVGMVRRWGRDITRRVNWFESHFSAPAVYAGTHYESDIHGALALLLVTYCMKSSVTKSSLFSNDINFRSFQVIIWGFGVFECKVGITAVPVPLNGNTMAFHSYGLLRYFRSRT